MFVGGDDMTKKAMTIDVLNDFFQPVDDVTTFFFCSIWSSGFI